MKLLLSPIVISAVCGVLLCAGCARQPFDSYQLPARSAKSQIESVSVSGLVTAGAISHPGMLAAGALTGYYFYRRQLYQNINQYGRYVRVGDGARIILPSDRLFLTSSYDIDSQEYSVLSDVVSVLQHEAFNKQITVADYTDDIGYRDLSGQLSKKRALALVNYLASHGLSIENLHAVAMTRRLPIAVNNRNAGYAYNRRIEISYG